MPIGYSEDEEFDKLPPPPRVKDPNSARHSKLKRPPSKTIQRPRDQCRLVITLEVQVEPDGMAMLPSYQKDATDYVRQLIGDADWKHIQDNLVENLYGEYVSVISIKAEANK